MFPLVIGFLGLGLSLLFEASRFCIEPTLLRHLFGNKTSTAAFTLTFVHSLLMNWVILFLPVYFQSVLGLHQLDQAYNYCQPSLQSWFCCSWRRSHEEVRKISSFPPCRFRADDDRPWNLYPFGRIDLDSSLDNRSNHLRSWHRTLDWNSAIRGTSGALGSRQRHGDGNLGRLAQLRNDIRRHHLCDHLQQSV